MQIQIDCEVPEGWRLGMFKNLCKCIFINNGVVNKKHDISKPLPDGWFKGSIQKSAVKGKIYINNGIEFMLIDKCLDIPIGWVVGRKF